MTPASLLRRAVRAVDERIPPTPWRDRTDWRLPPGPTGLPWFGPASEKLSDPLVALPLMQREYGDAIAFRAGPWWMNVLCHPDHVQHVLQDRHRNYDKATKGYDVLRIALGNGLLTAEGESWLRNRRLAQPAFHRRRIEALAGDMTRAAEGLRERWLRLADTGEAVDVAEEMMAVTLQIVCDTVLGARASGDVAARVSPALTVLLREANDRINAVPEMPIGWPTPANRRIREAIGTLDAVVEEMIAARRREAGREGHAGSDLLGLLMDAEDAETGERMDDRQLRDEVLTMFLAGHETTANLLGWALRLLSEHPRIARDLRDEARGVLGGRAATMADTASLPLTDAVLQEALRLYPPAWIIGRSAMEDDVIGGYDVPAGSVVLLTPWVTHRHPAFWTNPLGFDPERWLGGGPSHRWAFFPFGGGPRLCIGQQFALVEARILLATLVQDVFADLAPGYPITLDPLITLRPRDGLWMTLRRG
ncbi:MAG: cytochrome P450 [Deltaproteobacteria bacterium]|nr:MAG: cytochrome P450 [Deltaproteobacteria bacterium]